MHYSSTNNVLVFFSVCLLDLILTGTRQRYMHTRRMNGRLVATKRAANMQLENTKNEKNIYITAVQTTGNLTTIQLANGPNE